MTATLVNNHNDRNHDPYATALRNLDQRYCETFGHELWEKLLDATRENDEVLVKETLKKMKEVRPQTLEAVDVKNLAKSIVNVDMARPNALDIIVKKLALNLSEKMNLEEQERGHENSDNRARSLHQAITKIEANITCETDRLRRICIRDERSFDVEMALAQSMAEEMHQSRKASPKR